MTEPKNKTECTCECHLGFPWQEINGECIHCKPTQPQQADWEEEFDRQFTAKNKKMSIKETMLFEPTTGKIKQFIRTLLSHRTQSLLQGLEGLPTVTDWNKLDRRFVDLDDVKALIEKGGKC